MKTVRLHIDSRKLNYCVNGAVQVQWGTEVPIFSFFRKNVKMGTGAKRCSLKVLKANLAPKLCGSFILYLWYTIDFSDFCKRSKRLRGKRVFIVFIP